MTLYCDVDGTLLDSSVRHEKLLRDLLAARGLLWPAAAPDYLRYKADGHSTKAWLMLAGFAPETCAELADAWRTGIEQPEYLALDTVYPDTLPFLQAMRAAGRDVVLISARQNADALRQTLARCGILPLTAELLVVPPVQADRRKAELLRPRIAPGDVMLGDTEVDKSWGCRGSCWIEASAVPSTGRRTACSQRTIYTKPPGGYKICHNTIKKRYPP